MNIHAIDNQNFQANRQVDSDYNNRRFRSRKNVDAVINMDDRTVRKLAYAKTLNSVEDDKHRKLSKGIFLSIPLVAGLATAILNPAKSKLLTKEISGTSARLLNGAKSAATWGVLFGVADAVFGVKDFAEKKVPSLKKFSTENPLLSFAGTTAAFIGTLALGGKYLPKLAGSIIDKIKPEKLISAENRVCKFAESVNKNSVVNSTSDWAKRIADSKMMEPLKNIIKTTLSWAPSILLWGGVLHSLNHDNVKNKEFVKNYTAIKDFQANLAQARLREVSAQNDILMQNI